MAVGRNGALLLAVFGHRRLAAGVFLKALANRWVKTLEIADAVAFIAGQDGPHGVAVHHQKTVVGFNARNAQDWSDALANVAQLVFAVGLVGLAEQRGQALG